MLQRIDIIGNLVADAEEKVTSDGRSFVSFKVAVNEHGDSPEERKVVYYDIAYSKAGLLPYLKKGKHVFVSGRLNLSAVLVGGKAFLNASISAKDLELIS